VFARLTAYPLVEAPFPTNDIPLTVRNWVRGVPGPVMISTFAAVWVRVVTPLPAPMTEIFPTPNHNGA